MKKEILILSSVGILALIIGSAIFGSQIVKQNSIERQQKAELQIKENELNYQKQKDYEAMVEKDANEILLNACLDSAEDAYWTSVELNGTGKRDDAKGVTAPNWVWEDAKQDKAAAIDNCYRKFNN